MGPKIVVVGSANVDLIVKTSRIPQPGETIIGGEYSTALGGKGANQAVAAARLGAQVSMLGRVGGDSYGRAMLAGLQADGIDTTYLQEDPQTHTGVAFIIVDEQGQNSIVVSSGANMLVTSGDLEQAHAAVLSAEAVILQLEIPLEVVEHTAAIAAKHHIPVIFNPAPARPLPSTLLEQVSTLILNESETTLLTGLPVEDLDGVKSAVNRLHEIGVRIVILTMGKNGAFLSTQDTQVHIPAFQVTPIDTTAAGDAFVGAYTVALASGQSLPDSVRFASAAGALATTKLGAQPSLPRLAEVERLLKQ